MKTIVAKPFYGKILRGIRNFKISHISDKNFIKKEINR